MASGASRLADTTEAFNVSYREEGGGEEERGRGEGKGKGGGKGKGKGEGKGREERGMGEERRWGRRSISTTFEDR